VQTAPPDEFDNSCAVGALNRPAKWCGAACSEDGSTCSTHARSISNLSANAGSCRCLDGQLGGDLADVKITRYIDAVEEHRTLSADGKRYHHGSLRAALLDAAWAIVAEDGAEALSLRACARRAGVSHAAPIHHFGTLTGLAADLAALGYERLGAAMDEAVEPARDLLWAGGIGYVRFAVAHPEHFRMITRVSVSETASPRLRQAAAAALQRLKDGLHEAYRKANGSEPTPSLLAERATLAWSCVHGYAVLWVDGAVAREGLATAERLLHQLRPALVAP
jgi:AcrR family transcriptional regulator